MRRLPILIPHRPGCADFPLSVLHGRALLAEVQMTLSVTCRRRKTRGRTSALVSILASSATRCRFVDRFVRLKVLSRASRQRFSPHGTCRGMLTPDPIVAIGYDFDVRAARSIFSNALNLRCGYHAKSLLS